MEFNGTQLIAAPRATVWAYLVGSTACHLAGIERSGRTAGMRTRLRNI